MTKVARLLLVPGLIVLLATGALVAASTARADTPVVTLTASQSALTACSPLKLTASIDVPGAVLTLSRKRVTADDFTEVYSVSVAANGRVSWTLYPKHSLTYRVEFAGDTEWEAVSAEVTVSVRPRLKLAAPAAVYKGGNATFVTRVEPAHPGATVQLQRKVDGVWTDWQSITFNARSRGRYVWRSTRVTSFACRAVMAADESHIAGKSKKVTLTVRNPNPYSVPIGAAHFIVVDKSQYKLYYFERGRIVKVFRCVLGKASTPTPLGRFNIYAKDDNVGGAYGPRRMRYRGLYAIHGTNEPALLKRFPRGYSHGCTRLSNANILWLYARCPVGTRVWNVP